MRIGLDQVNRQLDIRLRHVDARQGRGAAGRDGDLIRLARRIDRGDGQAQVDRLAGPQFHRLVHRAAADHVRRQVVEPRQRPRGDGGLVLGVVAQLEDDALVVIAFDRGIDVRQLEEQALGHREVPEAAALDPLAGALLDVIFVLRPGQERLELGHERLTFARFGHGEMGVAVFPPKHPSDRAHGAFPADPRLGAVDHRGVGRLDGGPQDRHAGRFDDHVLGDRVAGAVLVGDGQPDGEGARRGEGVTGIHARALVAGAEVPGIRQIVPVGIGRAGGVQGDDERGRPLEGLGRERGDRWVVHAPAKPSVGVEPRESHDQDKEHHHSEQTVLDAHGVSPVVDGQFLAGPVLAAPARMRPGARILGERGAFHPKGEGQRSPPSAERATEIAPRRAAG